MKTALPERSIPGGSGGFTLLEVLIAPVILSIGLLGIAGLQGVGLRSSHGAYLSSQASLLAYDMADRIRANPQDLATYNGFSTTTVDCAAPPATPLAAADLAQWACAVEALLPNGSGTIAGVAAADGTISYTIALEWADLQVDDPADPWTFALDIDI
jgi:type IV pilus assembly protein PilV